MRTLTRKRKPGVVHKNFTGNLKADLERELLENQRDILTGSIEKHSYDSNCWKVAKKQLKKETYDKCAYCEAPTSQVAYGDVEHYRPKKTYWWLAYSYENYLVSCQLCNQKFKKAKFPIKNRRMPGPRITGNTTDRYIERLVGTIAPDPLDQAQVNAFTQLHETERPYLLNPYFDNPTDYFAWNADNILREVELTSIFSKPESVDYVNAAVNNYGLNRQELKEARYMQFMLFKTFKDTLGDPGISPATRHRIEQAIQEMKSDKAPFAGMIRYFDGTL